MQRPVCAGVRGGRVRGPCELQRGGARGRPEPGGRARAERGGRGVRCVVPRGRVRSVRRVERGGEEGNGGRVDGGGDEDARGRGVGGGVVEDDAPRGSGRGAEDGRRHGDPRESERTRRGERSDENDGGQETESVGERGGGRSPSGGRKPQAGTGTGIHFLSAFVSFDALLQHTLSILSFFEKCLSMMIWRESQILVATYATYAQNDTDSVRYENIVIVAACALINYQNEDLFVPI